MSTAIRPRPLLPWWKEPTKEQWLARLAAWLADRGGRKTPLMISILWRAVCNVIAVLIRFILAVLCDPETRGKELVPDLMPT